MRRVICCDQIIGVLVWPDELNINRSRRTEVQNLADHIGGLKEELGARKLRIELLAELIDIVLGGFCVLRL